jgi:hypothetical protein
VNAMLSKVVLPAVLGPSMAADTSCAELGWPDLRARGLRARTIEMADNRAVRFFLDN